MLTGTSPDSSLNIAHQGYGIALNEIRLLRNQLAIQLQEREDLLTNEIPHLEARYYSLLGSFQYDLLCLECEVRRLKRKIEMIQSALNRSEPVDVTQIDRQLEQELVDWNFKIRSLAHKLEAARILTSAESLTVDESKELRRLYYDLAKKVHPDLNPDQPGRLSSIWQQISNAYQCGSLEGMKALALLIDDLEEDVCIPEVDVVERRDALKGQLEKLATDIAGIRDAFPCTIREQLYDDEWIRKQREEIASKHSAAQQQKEQLSMVLAGMISGVGYEQQPDSH